MECLTHPSHRLQVLASRVTYGSRINLKTRRNVLQTFRVVEGVVLVGEDMGAVVGVCVVFNFLSAKLNIFFKNISL